MSQNFISSEALADLDQIFDYFAARSVEAGEKFTSEFKKKVSIFNSISESWTQLF